MKRPCHIYGLVDPRTDEIRYVGKTVNLRHRTRRHLRVNGTESPSLYRDRWIKTLIDEGLEFEVIVLEVVDECDGPDAERKWIADLRAQGARLTNLTDGGDGTPGFKFKEGTNRGSATKGRKKSAGFGAKVSAGLKKHISEHPETQERLQRNRSSVLGSFARDPDLLRRAKAASLRVQQDPAYQERRRARMRELAADPNWHAMRSSASKRNNNIGERNRVRACCLICRREVAVIPFKKHWEMHVRQGDVMQHELSLTTLTTG